MFQMREEIQKRSPSKDEQNISKKPKIDTLNESHPYPRYTTPQTPKEGREKQFRKSEAPSQANGSLTLPHFQAIRNTGTDKLRIAIHPRKFKKKGGRK